MYVTMSISHRKSNLFVDYQLESVVSLTCTMHRYRNRLFLSPTSHMALWYTFMSVLSLTPNILSLFLSIFRVNGQNFMGNLMGQILKLNANLTYQKRKEKGKLKSNESDKAQSQIRRKPHDDGRVTLTFSFWLASEISSINRIMCPTK